jgi:copper homeostasis protein CutC
LTSEEIKVLLEDVRMKHRITFLLVVRGLLQQALEVMLKKSIELLLRFRFELLGGSFGLRLYNFE